MRPGPCALGLLCVRGTTRPASGPPPAAAPPPPPKDGPLPRLLRTTGTDVPVILILTEGGLAVVTADWGVDDVVLSSVSPAEFEARLRLAVGRLEASGD